MGKGEAVARARRGQGVVDEEATALGIANRIQAVDDLVFGIEHLEINGGFETAKGHQNVAVRDGECEERALFNREESVGALADLGFAPREVLNSHLRIINSERFD